MSKQHDTVMPPEQHFELVASRVKSHEGNLEGYYISAETWRSIRSQIQHERGTSAEPKAPGSVIFTRMRFATHRAMTDRTWVRIADHEYSPWVAVNDDGNVICMHWNQLAASQL